MASGRSTRIGTVCAIMFVIACGGDGEKSGTGNESKADGGTEVTGAQSPIVAGRACTSATDCGAGWSCTNRLSYGSFAVIMESFGLGSTVPTPGGYCTRSCGESSECGEGGVCFGTLGIAASGECRKSCASNSDCRPTDYECAKTAEQPGQSEDDALLTELPATCQGLLKVDKLTDNQAGLVCNPEAAGDTTCGDGSCSSAAGYYGCSGICKTDADCGAGASCLTGLYGSAGVCMETCATDQDCAAFDTGEVGCAKDFEPGKSFCMLKAPSLPAGVVGKECGDDTPCAPGECTATLGVDEIPAPGGYCTLSNCEESAQCGGGTCVVSEFGSRCYLSCTTDADCREEYSCQERSTAEGAQGKVCAPTL